jgi:hypothetical protein
MNKPSRLFMPIIKTTGTPPEPVPVPVEPTPAPVVPIPEPQAPDTCGMNAQEQALYDLMASDPGQRRRNMRCHPVLVQVARAKALELARLNYFSHTAPDGTTPNMLVRRFGYILPDWYGDGNGIESLGAGYATAEMAFEGWLASPGHRAHVLGEAAFWEAQTRVGIGYHFLEGSPFTRYWVFLSAPVPV